MPVVRGVVHLAQGVGEHLPKDIPYGQDRIIVRWNKTRWRCREDYCKRSSFTEAIAQVPARARTTRRLRMQIGAGIGDAARSVSEVAASHGVSWPTAHRAFVAHADQQLTEPEPTRVLGIDETRRGKPRWEYCNQEQRWRIDPWDTGFVDLDGEQGLLGQREGRTGATVIAWLSQSQHRVSGGYRVRGDRPGRRIRLGDPHSRSDALRDDRGRPPLCRGPDYADVGWVGAGHGGDDAGEVGIIRVRSRWFLRYWRGTRRDGVRTQHSQS